MPRKTSDYGNTDAVTVLYSENADGDTMCVDIFQRADGSFGFELFRRDVETGQGWFRLGFDADTRFERMDDAVAAASSSYDWFQGPATNKCRLGGPVFAGLAEHQ